MQSMNEELLTVNIELQSKIADFIAIDSDMKNLLNSTDIATLFLDKELNIRKFTDKLTNIVKLRPIDIGRPFNEMVSDLQYSEIADHAREVLRTLISKESVIPTNDQRWFTVRIMPYRRVDDKIDGVVITFIDISAAKELEAKLAAHNIEEKEKRADELVIANKELEFQNSEKQKRADELVIANKELVFQNKEKEKRVAELVIANKELEFQNKEKENLKAELTKTINILREHNLYKP
jgi:two-component system CheB/CheR fusion protein